MCLPGLAVVGRVGFDIRNSLIRPFGVSVSWQCLAWGLSVLVIRCSHSPGVLQVSEVALVGWWVVLQVVLALFRWY